MFVVKLGNFLDKINHLWLIILGIIIILFGIYLFHKIDIMEMGGEIVRMNSIMKLFYEKLGKNALIIYIETFGIFLIISGVWNLLRK